MPALLIDGRVLTESLPICEYLEETRPERPLLPSDPFQRFKVRRLCEQINAGIQPLQSLAPMQKVESYGQDKKEWV